MSLSVEGLQFPGAIGTVGQHSAKLARSVYAGDVARLLREAIVGGQIPRGTPLVETRLAEQLAVSRGPIRSALQVLAGEGLVETRSNGRTVCVWSGHDDLSDLVRVRFELERTALEWGMASGLDTTILEKSFEALMAEGASTQNLVELDIDFHHALMGLSRSRFLIGAWLSIAPVIHSVITIGNRNLVAKDPESNYERIITSHRDILTAITAHDLEAASDLLAKQFTFGRSVFEEHLTENTAGTDDA